MIVDNMTELSKLKIQIGAELRRHRKDRGLSLKRTSEYLGVGETTLTKWEKGVYLPKQNNNFERLCALYGIVFDVQLPNPADVVGRAIKESRIEANNMSQTFLAEQIGVTRQTVSLYEKGEITPTKGNLGKIEIFFGKKIGYFKELIDKEMISYYALFLNRLRE